MTKKQKALGRGLDALLAPVNVQTHDNQAQSGGPLMIDIDKISPNPDQPRLDFDEKHLQGLADSIKEKGIIQPLVARELNDGQFQLIAGESRLKAAKIAELSQVPVIIMEIDEDPQARLELALVENIFRENLNPIEEALAFQRLEKEFGCTHQKIATLTARDRSTITNTLRLLKLPKHIQDDVRLGRLSSGHGRCLTGLADFSKMDFLRSEIITKNLSVRQTEALVKRANKSQSKAGGLSDRNMGDQAYFEELSKSFTNKLGGLKVKISHGGRVKKMEIFYNSNDDLELIMHKFGVRSMS